MRTYFVSVLRAATLGFLLLTGGVQFAYAQTPTSAPSIYKILPSSGPAGTEVTIQGSNFTPGASNNITFAGGGASYNVTPTTLNFFAASPYAQTLTFTAPSSIGPYCPPGENRMCPMYATRITVPGTYAITVVNANGTSNSASFTVTDSSPAPTPQPEPTCTFTRSLSVGSTGADVICLQTWLAHDRTLYPEGLVTGYFGSLTLAAVERLQASKGIVVSGTAVTTGYGYVGPRTRAALFAMFRGSTN